MVCWISTAPQCWVSGYYFTKFIINTKSTGYYNLRDYYEYVNSANWYASFSHRKESTSAYVQSALNIMWIYLLERMKLWYHVSNMYIRRLMNKIMTLSFISHFKDFPILSLHVDCSLQCVTASVCLWVCVGLLGN